MTAASLPAVHRPVVVFDTGIGSYHAVRLLHERAPDLDIVYLADRASFPYGRTSVDDLRTVILRTLRFIDGLDPSVVVMASNAPSITVLDDVREGRRWPLLGVRPPVREALDAAGVGEVAVLGVRSLTTSAQMQRYVAEQGGERADRVHLVDATALVELVETGDFLFEAERTRDTIEAFMAAELDARPAVSVLTLSSTHLPWLAGPLTRARPHHRLVDPIDAVIDEIVARRPQPGGGTLLGLVTESPALPAGGLRKMLDRLGVEIALHTVVIPA